MKFTSIDEVVRAIRDSEYCKKSYDNRDCQYASDDEFNHCGKAIAKVCEERLLSDVAVVKILVAWDPWAIDWVERRFKGDVDVALIGVSANGYTLKHYDSAVRDNLEIVLNAVRCAPKAARYASARLLDNEDVAFAAITRDCSSLEFFSDKIKNNKEIGMMLVNHDGLLLAMLSPSLQADSDIIKTALKKNIEAIPFVSRSNLAEYSFIKSLYFQFPQIRNIKFPYNNLIKACVDMRRFKVALGLGAVFLKDKVENRKFNEAAELAKENKITEYKTSKTRTVAQLAFFIFARNNAKQVQPTSDAVERELLKLYKL